MLPAFRSLFTLAAMALLGAPALAQSPVQTTPTNRIVVVDAGRSAKVKLSVDGCNPTWAAVSSDETVATVSDPGSKASGSKSLKISADKNAVAQQAQVTVTVTGAGPSCDQTVQVVFQVFVVMDAKRVEKAFKSGDKGTGLTGVNKLLGNYKKDLKQAEKDFGAQLKQILADMDAGTLTPPIESPAGTVEISQPRLAQIAMILTWVSYVSTVQALYWGVVGQMALAGSSALSSYGFFPFLAYAAPLSMQPGGCGLWDSSRLLAFGLMSATLGNLTALSKRFMSSLENASAKSGSHVLTNSLGGLFSDPGDGGTSPLTVCVPDPKLNKSLTIHRLWADNEVGDSLEQGRITVAGQSTDSSVSVDFQQLDGNGAPIGGLQSGSAPVDAFTCDYTLFWPPLSEPANLAPGTWKVTVSEAWGPSRSALITIPTQ